MKNFITSPIYHILCNIFDMVVLNLFYLLSCIPIVTIGAATAALHASIYNLRMDQGHPLQDYFRLFRDSLRKGLLPWILWLAGILIAVADFVIIAFYWSLPGQYVILGILALVLLLLFLWGSCLFATLTFCSDWKEAVKYAFSSCLQFLPRMIPVCILNLLPVWLVLCWPYGLILLSAFLLLIWFSLSAYINTIFLHPILERADNQE